MYHHHTNIPPEISMYINTESILCSLHNANCWKRDPKPEWQCHAYGPHLIYNKHASVTMLPAEARHLMSFAFWQCKMVDYKMDYGENFVFLHPHKVVRCGFCVTNGNTGSARDFFKTKVSCECHLSTLGATQGAPRGGNGLSSPSSL